MLAVSLPAVLFQCGEQKVFNLNGDFVNFAAQEKFFRQLDPAPEKIQQFPIGHSLTRLSAHHMCKVGGIEARTGISTGLTFATNRAAHNRRATALTVSF